MVCVLGGTSGVGVLNEKSASTMLVWFDSQKGEIPEERLAEFGTLLTRCQESPPTAGEPLILKTRQIPSRALNADAFSDAENESKPSRQNRKSKGFRFVFCLKRFSCSCGPRSSEDTGFYCTS
jgi:hypothetical protein